jgi:hypothetical protein
MRKLVAGAAVGLALLVPRAAEAHSILVIVFDLGGMGVAEPVSGFVGGGGRFRLGFGSDPAVSAIYVDAGYAAGTLRNAHGSRGLATYQDGAVGYRNYLEATDRRLFWSAELRYAIFGPGAVFDLASPAVAVGPVGELGYRLAPHVEAYVAIEPAILLKSGSPPIGVPVMVGLDLYAW